MVIVGLVLAVFGFFVGWFFKEGLILVAVGAILIGIQYCINWYQNEHYEKEIRTEEDSYYPPVYPQ